MAGQFAGTRSKVHGSSVSLTRSGFFLLAFQFFGLMFRDGNVCSLQGRESCNQPSGSTTRSRPTLRICIRSTQTKVATRMTCAAITAADAKLIHFHGRLVYSTWRYHPVRHTASTAAANFTGLTLGCIEADFFSRLDTSKHSHNKEIIRFE